MKTLLLLPYMASLCLMLACTASPAQRSTAMPQAAEPLLLLQKTPCLGSCPAYNATIYEDGHIMYVGFRSGQAQDTLHLALTEHELQQLKQEIAALHYKQLQDVYSTQWSDMPATYLTFYEAGRKVKRVKHLEGGPEQLVRFQDWLHQLVWQRAGQQNKSAQ